MGIPTWFRPRFIQSKPLLDNLLLDKSIRDYLTALNALDHEIYIHSQRVCQLSLDLGIENGFKAVYIRDLGIASLLHDIGKTRLPRHLLIKTESLDQDEFQTLRGHVRLGFLALADIQPASIKEIVVGHHEYSINPYPRNGVDRRQIKRKSNERRRHKPVINQITQILAAADMADALASKRCYKEGYSRDKLAATMRAEFRGDQRYVDQVLNRQPNLSWS